MADVSTGAEAALELWRSQSSKQATGTLHEGGKEERAPGPTFIPSSIDFLFIDHWKDLYVKDFEFLRSKVGDAV